MLFAKGRFVIVNGIMKKDDYCEILVVRNLAKSSEALLELYPRQ